MLLREPLRPGMHVSGRIIGADVTSYLTLSYSFQKLYVQVGGQAQTRFLTRFYLEQRIVLWTHPPYIYKYILVNVVVDGKPDFYPLPTQ